MYFFSVLKQASGFYCKKNRAVQGFEPWTSPTQTENHTTRPNGLLKSIISFPRGENDGLIKLVFLNFQQQLSIG